MTQPAVGDVGAVGSGVLIRRPTLADSNESDSALYTSGVLRIQCGWGTDSSGLISAPESPKSCAHRPLHVSRFDIGADVDYWVNQVQLDPNDPANVEIFDKIEVWSLIQSAGSFD